MTDRVHGNFRDLTGQRFNMLVVIERAATRHPGTIHAATYYLVRCDCGTEKEVPAARLKNNGTKSCGCLKKERFREHNERMTAKAAARAARCKGPRCNKQNTYGDYCKGHYDQFKNGKELKPIVKREKSEGTIDRAGYRSVWVPGHPAATKHGMCLEHRMVMSDHLGRPLLSTEKVHHINGDRLDNRIENLELWSTHQPMGQRVVDKVEYSIEMLTLYAPELLLDTAVAEWLRHHSS